MLGANGAFVPPILVIPFSITENWNLISRTIVPLISQDDVFSGMGSQSGLGDVSQALFFSPKAPTSGRLIWGVGPPILVHGALLNRS